MSVPLKDFRLGVTESIDLALYASSLAFGKDKAAIAREVLQEWADRKRHEHTVYARGLIANGMQAELPGFGLEDAGTSRKGRR